MAAGKPLMRLVLLPDEIENEDKLEMLNAGLIKLAVIDEPLFEFWKKVFPAIRSPGLVLRKERQHSLGSPQRKPQIACGAQPLPRHRVLSEFRSPGADFLPLSERPQSGQNRSTAGGSSPAMTTRWSSSGSIRLNTGSITCCCWRRVSRNRVSINPW